MNLTYLAQVSVQTAPIFGYKLADNMPVFHKIFHNDSDSRLSLFQQLISKGGNIRFDQKVGQ